jgi:hypothetical protein
MLSISRYSDLQTAPVCRSAGPADGCPGGHGVDEYTAFIDVLRDLEASQVLSRDWSSYST